jgi:signal transduction histidine kinase
VASLVFEVPLSRVDLPSYVDRFSLYRLISAVGLAAMGGLLATVRPRNKLGWLFLGLGALHAASLFLEGYGLADVWGQWSLPGGSWALWLGECISFPAYWLLPSLALLLCPDGRVPSPRWRPVAALAIGAAAVSTIGWALLSPDDSDVKTHPPGLAWPAPTWSFAPALQAIGAALGVVAVVLCIASVFVRYRAAREAERLQLKWLLVGALATVALLLCALLLPHAGWALALSSLALPAAVVVAILNGGLWDIDLVVSRSLVYGVLVGGVLGVYVLAVITLGDVLGRTTGAPLVATAIVAIGVNPARVWLTKMANHFVYGYRDDPTAVLHELSDRLDAAGAEDVVQRATDTLRRALRLDSVEVVSGTVEVFGRGERFPLVYQGQVVGALLVEPPPGAPLSARSRRTIIDVSRQLAVVVHAYALTDELMLSRERLVATREEERLRLRRELHDGLGPTLAAMALQTDRARTLMARDPQAASALLDQLAGRIRATVGDVRIIVDDLGVPDLADHGFGPALEQLAERFRLGGLDVDLSVVIDPGHDLPVALEHAGYRIVGEALTNVARHSGASRCAIAVHAAEALDITVSDDGRGFDASTARGIGLWSMEQRVAELGGTFDIAGGADGGTAVRVHIPVGQTVAS